MEGVFCTCAGVNPSLPQVRDVLWGEWGVVVMQWVVGTDERERRAIINFRLDTQMKTLSYTTSLAPFFFWSWMWSGFCFSAEAPPRPRAPVPFSSRGPHPQTIPIKPRPLLNPSFFPVSSQMTNNMTFGTKVQIYSLWSNTTTFSHWKKNNK